MNILNLIGLILGLVASIIFVIDSNRMFNAITLVLQQFYGKIGTYGGKPAVEIMQNLQREADYSRSRNIFGFTLFGVSFLLQFIAAL